MIIGRTRLLKRLRHKIYYRASAPFLGLILYRLSVLRRNSKIENDANHQKSHIEGQKTYEFKPSIS